MGKWFMALVGLAALGACAQGPMQEAEAARAGLPILTQDLSDYRLGSGDALRITVFGEADLSGDFTVNTQGAIAFPLIGDVTAGGRTLRELEVELADRLRGSYVLQPNISIEVTNHRPFFILGEVNAPGTYPYAGGLTVLNAVATAGGFTPRADQRRVYVKHAGDTQERIYALTTAASVRPGDTIRIPERRF